MTFHVGWAVFLLFLALVCFVLAVFSVPRVQWIALGLAIWVLVVLLQAAGTLT